MRIKIDIPPELFKELKNNDYTNEGHAMSFLAMYGGKFHFNEQVGWLQWVGTHWSANGAFQAAFRAMLNVLTHRRHVLSKDDNFDMKLMKRCEGDETEVRKSLKVLSNFKQVYLPFTAFDDAIGFLNCKNGVVDLRTGQLEPHDSSQKFTYCLPVDYKRGATAEPWKKFLADIGLSAEVRQYVQKAVGYSITGETREEVMFYLYGKPRSGKGTFTEVLELMLGQLSSGVNFRTFTEPRHGDTSNFDLAPLKNKRLLTASESSRYRQLNTAVIKQITGGDAIYCSFKRKDHFSYRPMFVVWLTSNWPVNADVDDDAAWGRLKVIKFPNSFLGKEDKTLKPRLKKQSSLEGVLAWAVAGAMAWYASLPEGLKEPDEVKQEVTGHRDELDSVGQFVEQCCELDDSMFTVGALLYAEYKEWCNDEGHTPKRRRSFTTSLDTRGIGTKQKKVAGTNKRGYVGIGIKN